MEDWYRQLEKATLASLETFELQDAVLAFAVTRDPTVLVPADLPPGDARERLSALFDSDVFHLSPDCPDSDNPPPNVLRVGGPCSLGVLLASTLVRAAIRADGFSALGALVAGSGVPASPCPSWFWTRVIVWLNSHCAGTFDNISLPLVSFWAHWARRLGVSIRAPYSSSPLEEWRVLTSGRRYSERNDLRHDIRNFPCPLAAISTLLFDHPIRVWGPSGSFTSTTRRTLATLVSGGVTLSLDDEVQRAARRSRTFYICEMIIATEGMEAGPSEYENSYQNNTPFRLQEGPSERWTHVRKPERE